MALQFYRGERLTAEKLNLLADAAFSSPAANAPIPAPSAIRAGLAQNTQFTSYTPPAAPIFNDKMQNVIVPGGETDSWVYRLEDNFERFPGGEGDVYEHVTFDKDGNLMQFYLTNGAGLPFWPDKSGQLIGHASRKIGRIGTDAGKTGTTSQKMRFFDYARPQIPLQVVPTSQSSINVFSLIPMTECWGLKVVDRTENVVKISSLQSDGGLLGKTENGNLRLWPRFALVAAPSSETPEFETDDDSTCAWPPVDGTAPSWETVGSVRLPGGDLEMNVAQVRPWKYLVRLGFSGTPGAEVWSSSWGIPTLGQELSCCWTVASWEVTSRNESWFLCNCGTVKYVFVTLDVTAQKHPLLANGSSDLTKYVFAKYRAFLRRVEPPSTGNGEKPGPWEIWNDTPINSSSDFI